MLKWIEQSNGRCHADSGDRTYIVDVFDVGARDGDPLLTVHDGRYRSTCWAMRLWVGNDTHGPVRLFDSRNDAKRAAEEMEVGS